MTMRWHRAHVLIVALVGIAVAVVEINPNYNDAKRFAARHRLGGDHPRFIVQAHGAQCAERAVEVAQHRRGGAPDEVVALPVRARPGHREELAPQAQHVHAVALVVGAVAGALFVGMFTWTQNRWKIDDVLGVWPLHGLCGTWGGLAAGIFGTKALGGLGGVHPGAQLAGTLLGVLWALIAGAMVYGVLRRTVGLRLSAEEEFEGADLAIHRISATPEHEATW